MSKNVGSLDRYFRIFAGIALLAYAFQNGFSISGWHWAGLIGIIPLVTALFGVCPFYSLIGTSTCETAN